jgi:MFS family permease
VEQFFRRNTVGISGVEFFWGLGMPVVIESTFLQLLLRNLGASSFLIGLVPTLFSGGVALFSLVAGTLTGHLERKRPAVIIAHAAAALPLLGFGIVLAAFGFISSILLVFFSCYAMFSIGIGLTLPVWQNYLVKIFTENRSIPALAVMFTVQSIAKVLSSFFIMKLVERYSFSATGASIIFISVGCVLVGGSFMFLITREEEENGLPPAPMPRRGMLHAFPVVLRNRNFLTFLGTDLDFFALMGIISFYANFATEYCLIDPALASGLFVACNYFGGISTNILLGWFRLFSLKNKYWVTKVLALAAVPLVCFSSGLWSFLLASYLFGASRSTRMLVFPPAVKRLSGLADATQYFCTAPLLTLPLSVGIPLINGACLDRLAALGPWSYRLVFLAMGGLSALGLLFLSRVDSRNLESLDRRPAGARYRRPSGP